MPRRNGISLQVLLLPLALLALVAAAFGRRRGDEWDWETEEPEPEPELPPAAVARRRRPSTRFGTAALLTTLFFAGAAFTAGAGDQMAKLLDDDVAALAELDEIDAARDPAAAEPATDPAAAPEVAPDAAEAAQAPAAEPTPEAAVPPAVAEETEAVQAAPTPDDELAPPAPAVAATPGPSAPAASARTATPHRKAVARKAPPPVKPKAKAKKPAVKHVLKAAAPAPPPEIEHQPENGYGEPTIWLNRTLPDPTPKSARLTRSFAKRLVATAKQHDADWAAVLGVLRAQGHRGSTPAATVELESIASRLATGQAWRGALALSGRTDFADRAEALADLYRSVGIETLITGYAKSKERLAKRLLENEFALIYEGGREDIEAGRIDVRILVLIGYLVERHGSIAVSSLFAGHRKFARPGVVSAHIYGHAIDVAAVNGTTILGHQEPGGLTETTVRSVLLLPTELQPQQVISLLGLGGPSFPMRDHGDHIHIGY